MGSRRRERHRVDLRIAPLIDLVFILLIFFLVGARFTREAALPIQRPAAATAAALEGSPLVVTVTATGTVHLDGERVALGFLPERVRSALFRDPRRPVLVAADRRVPTGRLVAVMDACRVGGARRLLLAAEEGREP